MSKKEKTTISEKILSIPFFVLFMMIVNMIYIAFSGDPWSLNFGEYLKSSPALIVQCFYLVLAFWIPLFILDFCFGLIYEKPIFTESFMKLTFGCAATALIIYLLFLTTPAKNLVTHVQLIGTILFFSVLFYWTAGRPQKQTASAVMVPAGLDHGTDTENGNARPSLNRKKLIPNTNFGQICGNDAIKQRIGEAAQAITSRRSGESVKRNGILLHGEPGNGKTVFAQALAGEMKLPIIEVSIGDVTSKWVGEKTELIRNAFEDAKRIQPCVLFIDEVDSFLSSRDSLSNGIKEDRDMVNALLTFMVNIRQEQVILMAATNHMDQLDSAGIREGRFDFKIEITPPDEAARIGLLKHGLAKNLPRANVPLPIIESVARRWNGYSVKRILAVTEELPSYLRSQKKSNPEFDDFMGALRHLQGRKGEVPENVKSMSELILSADTREMLDIISARMLDPERTESLGGTLPTGVLFYGPPGTGKTATCKALAHELQWTFLTATGADLARDPKSLEKLYAKAKELRPAIIFIDEADELLKSREFSQQTESTNKLLTLMDGIKDRVKDVVWIAATNNPETIDPALLRGGRFTEKVVFEKPDQSGLGHYIANWLANRKVQLEAQLRVQDIVQFIGDESIANAEAIIQAGLNRAISRRSQTVVLTFADIQQGARAVLG